MGFHTIKQAQLLYAPAGNVCFHWRLRCIDVHTCAVRPYLSCNMICQNHHHISQFRISAGARAWSRKALWWSAGVPSFIRTHGPAVQCLCMHFKADSESMHELLCLLARMLTLEQ